MITFNPLTTLADVRTPDGALLGAVPNDRRGLAAAGDAITAYQCAAADTPATQPLRLRVARRIIVMAGGTPATAQRPGELWESAVWRHQRVLMIAGGRREHWFYDLERGEEAARVVGL